MDACENESGCPTPMWCQANNRCPKAESEGAPSEPPAPQGSLRCDGVVGLRVESAEALWLTWHKEALACDQMATGKDAYNRGWYDGQAYVFRQKANWLQGICRQAGYEIPRQPEPNGRDQGRADAASK